MVVSIFDAVMANLACKHQHYNNDSITVQCDHSCRHTGNTPARKTPVKYNRVRTMILNGSHWQPTSKRSITKQHNQLFNDSTLCTTNSSTLTGNNTSQSYTYIEPNEFSIDCIDDCTVQSIITQQSMPHSTDHTSIPIHTHIVHSHNSTPANCNSPYKPHVCSIKSNNTKTKFQRFRPTCIQSKSRAMHPATPDSITIPHQSMISDHHITPHKHTTHNKIHCKPVALMQTPKQYMTNSNLSQASQCTPIRMQSKRKRCIDTTESRNKSIVSDSKQLKRCRLSLKSDTCQQPITRYFQ